MKAEEMIFQKVEEMLDITLEKNRKLYLANGDKNMYKYCRDVMWSAEDNAFVAIVLELVGCQADGKTVVEAMNNLDIVIEEWIETAKEMGRAIPSPMYYEPVEFAQVPEDEKVPYYDSGSKTWRVVTEWGREEEDAIFI